VVLVVLVMGMGGCCLVIGLGVAMLLGGVGVAVGCLLLRILLVKLHKGKDLSVLNMIEVIAVRCKGACRWTGLPPDLSN